MRDCGAPSPAPKLNNSALPDGFLEPSSCFMKLTSIFPIAAQRSGEAEHDLGLPPTRREGERRPEVALVLRQRQNGVVRHLQPEPLGVSSEELGMAQPILAPSPLASSSSAVYSRTVSNIKKRPCAKRRRLLSTSDCRVSMSASQISCAASSVQPPAKTASRAKRCCSSGLSSSYDHSIVARSVRWRASASRPPLRRSSPSERWSRICAGGEHARAGSQQARPRAGGCRGECRR